MIPVERSAFRHAMARWATGVSVVTASADGVDVGLTVNSFLSVSLGPPSVLVSLMHDVDSLPYLERSRSFAVSILAYDQKEVSERFARAVPSSEKFRGLPVHRGATGAGLIDGALGWIECRLTSVIPLYDHRLVVGEVVGLEEGRDVSPLLFFRSGYATADSDGLIRLPSSRGSSGPVSRP
jgi:3-hydroxy-9,10-secoandrosta-1,3,5(10)-triene-9,17-dione monooxygenase reductase component